MSKEVDADLYEFLKENETGMYMDETKVIAYVLIPFESLNEFVGIVGAGYFDDGGKDCTLIATYISVSLNEIIEEGYEQYLHSYKRCFDEDVWNDYEPDILNSEKE